MRIKFRLSLDNIPNVLYVILSLACYCSLIVIIVYDLFPRLIHGELSLDTIASVAAAATGCASGVYLGRGLLKKIIEEMFTLAVGTPCLSILSFVVLNYVLGYKIELSQIVTFSIIAANILAYILIGNTRRQLFCNVSKVFVKHSLSVLTILVLVCMSTIPPLLQASMSLQTSGSLGREEFMLVPMNGGRVDNENEAKTFNIDFPLSNDLAYKEIPILNFTTNSFRSRTLKMCLCKLEGPTSKIEQFRLYFVLSTGTTINPLTISQGDTYYNDQTVNVCTNTSVEARIYSRQNSICPKQSVRIHMILDDRTDSISYSIIFSQSTAEPMPP